MGVIWWQHLNTPQQKEARAVTSHHWWRRNRLYGFLAMPASQAFAERVFTVTGDLITGWRSGARVTLVEVLSLKLNCCIHCHWQHTVFLIFESCTSVEEQSHILVSLWDLVLYVLNFRINKEMFHITTVKSVSQLHVLILLPFHNNRLIDVST